MSGPRRLRTVCLTLVVAAVACSEPVDPMLEIRDLHEQRRFADSVPKLRALLDADPTRAEANLLLGQALMQTGDSGVAIWPLQRAAEAPQYAIEANLLLAQVMLESRTAPDAITAVDRVLAIEPDNVRALALRVRAQLATGALDEGLADIDRVLELDPDNLAVLVPRVSALIATEQIDEAEKALEIARERLADTKERVPPGMVARLCIARGMFAFEKDEPEAARSQFESCLEQFPDDQLVVTESVAFYDRLDERERGTEILEAAFEKTGSAFFRVALARRLGALGSAEDEERLLREQAQEHSTPVAWFTLANYFVERGDFEAALPAFEKALAARPNPSPKLRFAYADTLIQAKRYADARRVAAEIEQDELRSLLRGRILLAEGDARGALEALEAGIRLWPNNAAGRYFAGLAAERLGDFERAISEYRESVRANPGQTSAGLELARLYLARAQLDDALAAAGSYVRSHRTDPQGYLLTIRIAHGLGLHDVAADGLARLGALPDQAAVAAAEEARLIASGPGPAVAVEAIEGSELDLSDSANAPALRAMCQLLAELGEHARSRALVQRALDAHPDAAVLHEIHGRVLQTDDPAGARAAFERALALDADDARALSGLADLAAARGETDEAVALYDRAAAGDPEDAAYPLAAAMLLVETGDSQQARTRLEQLLASHPRQPDAMLALARLLVARGELDRAIALAANAEWLGAPDATETRLRIQEQRAAEDGTAPASG